MGSYQVADAGDRGALVAELAEDGEDYVTQAPRAIQEKLAVELAEVDDRVLVVEAFVDVQSIGHAYFARSRPEDDLMRGAVVVSEDDSEIDEIAAGEFAVAVSVEFGVDDLAVLILKKHVRMDVFDDDTVRWQTSFDSYFPAEGMREQPVRW